jgi:signal transduction histidine kinase
MTFRTRLFITTILIVATVVAVVMLLTWSRIMQFELERLDDRLCIEGKRMVLAQQRDGIPPDLASDLAVKLRVNESSQLLARVETLEHEALFESANWKNELSLDALSWGEALLGPASDTLALNGPREAKYKHEHLPQERCQLAHFKWQDRQWRGALYTRATSRSFIATDLAATKSELQNAVRYALAVVIPLALLLTALGAWLLARLTSGPIHRLHDAMQVVTQKALNHRLSDQGEDREFQLLIQAYNTMLARLERSFVQASRFSADAAHELKTPLTILRGRVEQAIQCDSPQQVDLYGMLDEVSKLTGITRKLLLLSQADAGSLTLHRTSVDLSQLLGELLADLELLPEAGHLDCSIEPDLVIQGDDILLNQLFNNIVSNGIRYGLAGGTFGIKALRKEALIEVTCCNPCGTLRAAERHRLFDRFYRGDFARHQGGEGSGLGLSLAREIARAHGGDLTLEPTPDDLFCIRLSLPLCVSESRGSAAF